MNLPSLDLQMVYGRLAWAIVFTGLALVLLRRRFAIPKAAGLGLAVLSAAVAFLPGAASPAYWLELAMQWPSALSTMLCLLLILDDRPDAGRGLLPWRLSAAIMLVGAVLYLDGSGWIAIGMYFGGFSPLAAPVAALALGALCAGALLRGAARPQAVALLGALLAYMIARLPTGNLWDALLDPVLWMWCSACAVGGAWRHRALPGRMLAARRSASAPAA